MSRRRGQGVTRARLIGAGVFVGGIMFGAMAGEYSTIDWIKLNREVRETERTVARLETEVDSMAAYADSIETNRVTQERVAREKFGMLEDGEIVYMWEPQRR